MRAYLIENAGPDGRIVPVERATPEPGTGEVLVRIRATSLNYRDLMVLRGGYPRNQETGIVPLSDGAGDIVALGDGVEGWAVGDRVAINFMRDWALGDVDERGLSSGFGGGIDGMLADYVAVPASALAAIPDSLSYAEAATLPCAAVTAWHGLRRVGAKPGDTILLLGTGGVSIFALQLARAWGVRTIITSGSDEKLARARALGADETINYRTRPDWDAAARELTGGIGVDSVIEVGGPGTFDRSLAATRPSGHIALIGVLAQEPVPAITPILLHALTVHGIYVGSTAMLRETIAAVAANGIKPAIDRTFAFDDAVEAYAEFATQQHFGKLVILNE